MDYALANELKDAGWPQRFHSGGVFPKSAMLDRPEDLAVPSLEELIEACGKDFYELKRVEADEWYATTFRPDWKMGNAIPGKLFTTPKEAVARLWLALNRK